MAIPATVDSGYLMHISPSNFCKQMGTIASNVASVSNLYNAVWSLLPMENRYAYLQQADYLPFVSYTFLKPRSVSSVTVRTANISGLSAIQKVRITVGDIRSIFFE
jgi:hypothetical protein